MLPSRVSSPDFFAFRCDSRWNRLGISPSRRSKARRKTSALSMPIGAAMLSILVRPSPMRQLFDKPAGVVRTVFSKSRLNAATHAGPFSEHFHEEFLPEAASDPPRPRRQPSAQSRFHRSSMERLHGVAKLVLPKITDALWMISVYLPSLTEPTAVFLFSRRDRED